MIFMLIFFLKPCVRSCVFAYPCTQRCDYFCVVVCKKIDLKMSSAKWCPFCPGLKARDINMFVAVFHYWGQKKSTQLAPLISLNILYKHTWMKLLQILFILLEPFIWLRPGVIVTSHFRPMAWKCFPHCWPFVRGINSAPVDSSYKGIPTLRFDEPCLPS